MQKEVRLDMEFENLEQGGMSHADFRALFESKIQDMEESSMDMPTQATLYRKYLTKLNPEIRPRVLSKEWKIDGDDKPPRQPTTYRDVARAVGLLLEEMADATRAEANLLCTLVQVGDPISIGAMHHRFDQVSSLTIITS